MKSTATTIASCVLASLLVAVPANAHVPFLKPNQFHVLNNRLVIESSFTEFPFQADFAMSSPHFGLILPDGNRIELLPAAKTKGAVYLEPRIDGEGTYRINSGTRKGPRYRGDGNSRGKALFFGRHVAFYGTQNRNGLLQQRRYLCGKRACPLHAAPLERRRGDNPAHFAQRTGAGANARIAGTAQRHSGRKRPCSGSL